MIRHLLDERFHLKFHREIRETPSYTLTVQRGRTGMVITAAQNQWTFKPIAAIGIPTRQLRLYRL